MHDCREAQRFEVCLSKVDLLYAIERSDLPTIHPIENVATARNKPKFVLECEFIESSAESVQSGRIFTIWMSYREYLDGYLRRRTYLRGGHNELMIWAMESDTNLDPIQRNG